MITISNNKQLIASTNYWHSDYAKNGKYFLSWNAGTARLLMPNICINHLNEMKTAEYVIISRGFWSAQGTDGLELLFEDNSDNPFLLTIASEQTDRTLPDDNQGGGFEVVVWTDKGIQLTLPGKYRRVEILPCMEEWKEQ